MWILFDFKISVHSGLVFDYNNLCNTSEFYLFELNNAFYDIDRLFLFDTQKYKFKQRLWGVYYIHVDLKCRTAGGDRIDWTEQFVNVSDFIIRINSRRHLESIVRAVQTCLYNSVRLRQVFGFVQLIRQLTAPHCFISGFSSR